VSSSISPVFLSHTSLVCLHPFALKIDFFKCSKQGCTKFSSHVPKTTEFCTLAPNICVYLGDMKQVLYYLEPRIVRRFLDFFENLCATWFKACRKRTIKNTNAAAYCIIWTLTAMFASAASTRTRARIVSRKSQGKNECGPNFAEFARTT